MVKTNLTINNYINYTRWVFEFPQPQHTGGDILYGFVQEVQSDNSK